MRSLAIETSSLRGSLALLSGARLEREIAFPEGLVHGREITARLDRLCAEAAWRPEEIEGIAVGVGPGSYTGCRVGVTAAKSLALALRIPLIPISSLRALARGVEAAGADAAPGSRVLPLVDARRGRFYHALFTTLGPGAAGRTELSCVADDRIGGVGEVCRLARPGDRVLGDGADAFLAACASQGGYEPLPEALERVDPSLDIPAARWVGGLATGRLAGARFDPESIHRVEPAYLRPSEPEIVWARRRQADQRSPGAGPPPGAGA